MGQKIPQICRVLAFVVVLLNRILFFQQAAVFWEPVSPVIIGRPLLLGCRDPTNLLCLVLFEILLTFKANVEIKGIKIKS
jgi:hypothetical protein